MPLSDQEAIKKTQFSNNGEVKKINSANDEKKDEKTTSEENINSTKIHSEAT